MAAGVYVATSSENEVRRTQRGKERFLGENRHPAAAEESAITSAIIVGVGYFAGAAVPILPVFFGAKNALVSVITGGATIIFVSTVLAFLSGMDVRKRILTNLIILAAAVAVTYGIGILVRTLFGVAL
jgi:VIT1/CCC1 family predicted Fe2+/Mn2+ transporter